MLKYIPNAIKADKEELQAAHDRLFAPIVDIPVKEVDVIVAMPGTVTSRDTAEAAAVRWHEIKEATGREIPVVGGGGVLARDNWFAVGLWASQWFNDIDRETYHNLPKGYFFPGLIEGELIEKVLKEQGVPDHCIEIVGLDCKNTDKVIDAVLDSDAVKRVNADGGAMAIMHYGPGALRDRATIDLFNQKSVEAGLAKRFGGAIIPEAVGVGAMQTDNWPQSFTARLHVISEYYNMRSVEEGGYVGKYCNEPLDTMDHHNALIEHVRDLYR